MIVSLKNDDIKKDDDFNEQPMPPLRSTVTWFSAYLRYGIIFFHMWTAALDDDFNEQPMPPLRCSYHVCIWSSGIGATSISRATFNNRKLKIQHETKECHTHATHTTHIHTHIHTHNTHNILEQGKLLRHTKVSESASLSTHSFCNSFLCACLQSRYGSVLSTGCSPSW